MDFGMAGGSQSQSQGGGSGSGSGSCVVLPLYVEEWAEEVLSRVQALVSNLESGLGHRTDQAASSRLEANGTFLMSVR